MEQAFSISLTNDKQVKEFNEKHGTDFKTDQEQFEDVLTKIIEMFLKCADEGGFYAGDNVEITVKCEYKPEDK